MFRKAPPSQKATLQKKKGKQSSQTTGSKETSNAVGGEKLSDSSRRMTLIKQRHLEYDMVRMQLFPTASSSC
jgi:hypothetical protein